VRGIGGSFRCGWRGVLSVGVKADLIHELTEHVAVKVKAGRDAASTLPLSHDSLSNLQGCAFPFGCGQVRRGGFHDAAPRVRFINGDERDRFAGGCDSGVKAAHGAILNSRLTTSRLHHRQRLERPDAIAVSIVSRSQKA
jgi:hypothetical protein